MKHILGQVKLHHLIENKIEAFKYQMYEFQSGDKKLSK